MENIESNYCDLCYFCDSSYYAKPRNIFQNQISEEYENIKTQSFKLENDILN